jgi:hypothetical protein
VGVGEEKREGGCSGDGVGGEKGGGGGGGQFEKPPRSSTADRSQIGPIIKLHSP